MNNKKITLMTSGDKGIGKCIVEVLAEEGYRFFLLTEIILKMQSR